MIWPVKQIPLVNTKSSWKAQGLSRLSENEWRLKHPDAEKQVESAAAVTCGTKANLPHVRFHDLRHFFASMLIAQGESPKYVCDQLGHSSVQVTFDIYGHLFPTARQEAARKFQDAMLLGSRKLVAETDLEGDSGEGPGGQSGRVN